MDQEDLDYLPPPAGRTLPMAMAAYVISVILATIAFVSVREGAQDPGDLTGPEFFAVNLPSSLALAAAALLLAAPGLDPLRALRLRVPPGDEHAKHSRWGQNSHWRGVPTGFVVGLIAQAALVPLYIPILWIFDGEVGEVADDLAAQFVGSELLLLVVMVVVMAPIAEELFFRGLIQGSIERSKGPWVAVPVTALVFAAVHFQLLLIPGLFFFGVVTGVLLVRYQRLTVSIAAHVGFNTAGIIGILADRLG